MVEYHVPVAPGGVASIFGLLEANKAVLQIKHFSVSQTTLDEVRYISSLTQQYLFTLMLFCGTQWEIFFLEFLSFHTSLSHETTVHSDLSSQKK